MNRKEFIKGIGVVAGAATFVPRTKAVDFSPCSCGTGGGAAGTLPDRVLGSGRAAMSVSTLGFGGLTYNRSQHSDKQRMAHLCENLHTLDFTLSAGDIAELERTVETIPVIGDRYDAEQQKRVLG